MFNNKSHILLSLAALLSVCAAKSVNNIHRNSNIVSRESSTRGQFPFYALVIGNTEYGTTECGGSLIDRQWVLTAAQCVTGARSFQIHLGALQYDNITETGRVIINATRSFIHPFHVPFLVWNDIGLIRLDWPVDFSDTIQPIGIDTSDLTTNTSLTYMGFINYLNETGVLQHAQLNSISNWECVKDYPFIAFRRSVVCANRVVVNFPCGGEIGGPLIRPNPVNPRAPTLVGLASFGSINCHMYVPVVSTRVSLFLPWIQWTIDNNPNQMLIEGNPN